MTTQTTTSICSEDRRIAGMAYPRTCEKCGLGPCQNHKREEAGISKEKILTFAKHKRDTATDSERPFYAAIYFVLRNRTEENWGPKELSFGEAMGEAMKDGVP